MTTEDQMSTQLAELAWLHQNYLSAIATGVGGDDARANPSYVVKRPWIDPPDGYISYDEAGKVALPAVGSTSTIVTFTVPDGYDGVINGYSWNFVGGGFTEASGDLVVKITRDLAPIRNYDNVLVQKGTIGNPRMVSPIRVFSKQVIALIITHAANVALNGDVVGSFVGYFYPNAS
jgi:hypothetical protein